MATQILKEAMSIMTQPAAASPSDQAQVAASIEAALGRALIPPGTPATRAVHDLYLSECRQLGTDVAGEAWATLPPPRLREIAWQLKKLTRNGGPDYVLPAGTPMMECVHGCVVVGSEELGFDVDRPGLNAADDLPTRPGGRNLDLLLEGIVRRLRDSPCADIGEPQLLERFGDCGPVYRLQFPPFAPAQGVVLERDMDFPAWGELFCALTREEIDGFAEEAAADVARLLLRNPSLDTAISNLRRAAERVVDGVQDAEVHALTVNFAKLKSPSAPFLSVEFWTWDHAFRRGIVVREHGPCGSRGAELDCADLHRRDRIEELRRLGANGWISGVARAIAAAAPGGAEPVLVKLAHGFEAVVPLTSPSGGRFVFRLYWADGQIVAQTRNGFDIDIRGDTIRLNGKRLPEAVADSLAGHPLHIVFDEPFRCDTRIARVQNVEGALLVETEPDSWLLDCGTGRTWRRPG